MSDNNESPVRAAVAWLMAAHQERHGDDVAHAQIPAQLRPAYAVQGVNVAALIAVRRANGTIDAIAIDSAPDERDATRFRRFRNMRRIVHSAFVALVGLLLPLLTLLSELPALWAAGAPLTALLAGGLFYAFSPRWSQYALMDGVTRARRLPANTRYLLITARDWNALTLTQRGKVQRDCIGSGVGLLRVRSDGNVTRLHEPGMVMAPRELRDFLACYVEGDALRAALPVPAADALT